MYVDRYSTIPDANSPSYQYRKGLHNSKIQESQNPTEGETLRMYHSRLGRAVKEAEEISVTAHIYGSKVWLCHKMSGTCFICTNNQFLNNLYQTITSLVPSQGDKWMYHFQKPKEHDTETPPLLGTCTHTIDFRLSRSTNL